MPAHQQLNGCLHCGMLTQWSTVGQWEWMIYVCTQKFICISQPSYVNEGNYKRVHTVLFSLYQHQYRQSSSVFRSDLVVTLDVCNWGKGWRCAGAFRVLVMFVLFLWVLVRWVHSVYEHWSCITCVVCALFCMHIKLKFLERRRMRQLSMCTLIMGCFQDIFEKKSKMQKVYSFHSSNKYLCNTYYVSSTVLGIEYNRQRRVCICVYL